MGDRCRVKGIELRHSESEAEQWAMFEACVIMQTWMDGWMLVLESLCLYLHTSETSAYLSVCGSGMCCPLTELTLLCMCVCGCV